MNEEEMYDVNGGTRISNAILGFTLDAIIIVTAAWMQATNVGAIATKIISWLKNKFMALCGTLASGLITVAGVFGIAIPLGATAGLTNLIAGAIGISLGTLVAMGIDWFQDGRVDGYVSI